MMGDVTFDRRTTTANNVNKKKKKKERERDYGTMQHGIPFHIVLKFVL